MPEADERIADLREQAERLASKLPPLQVAAHRVAATVRHGLHGRRRAGQGDTFWQFRRYQTFDTARAVDWRRSAKSWRTYVRQTEWEAAQSVWLWRDASLSMHYRSHRSLNSKSERADILTLALAILLTGAEENVALLGQGIRPRSGRPAVELITNLMLNSRSDMASLPPLEHLPRNGELVLIGDFLSPSHEIKEVIGHYSSLGISGHVLQISDPAEQNFPFKGRVRFEGMEQEAPFLLSRADSAREDYGALYAAHCAALRDMTTMAGWTFQHHSTDSPPESALLTMYGALLNQAAWDQKGNSNVRARVD